MSDAAGESGKKKTPRVDALEAEVAELTERIQRMRDGRWMSFGALIGVAAMLVTVAWYAGQKTYEEDKKTLIEDLTLANEGRYQSFVKKLSEQAPAQDLELDRKIAVKWQELLARVNSMSGNSSTNFQALRADLENKIRLMTLATEQRYGDAFGFVYMNRAISAVNVNKDYAQATELFLAAALVLWKANKFDDFQTCLARINDTCFKVLNRRMLVARPTIEEKYIMLLVAMEKGNTGNRWQVAINDLRAGWARVQQRP